MAADERWYFTKEQIQNTPSRKCGFDADKELSYRQQAANFIQDMGQKLQVTQLCINTAIVYMHRFYMFHSFTHFPWNTIAAASFFLAAKVEEQPRKLEHVIRATNVCLHREQAASFDVKSEQYAAQSQELVFNENVLLQTLGFDVAIDHPHTHVVRCCHLVKASKDLAQTSYFMASNSLHLTTMCLQYKPTVVACFCIHLACKWSNWQIPKSNEGRDWFYYVDKTVTSDLLEQLTTEFLVIFDKCPSRLKRKILSISSNNPHGPTEQQPTNYSPSEFEPRRVHPDKQDRAVYEAKASLQEDYKKRGPDGTQRVDYREYKEKKERERYEREKQLHAKQAINPTAKPPMPNAPVNKPSHNHHRSNPNIGSNPSNDPNKMQKAHHRPVTVNSREGQHIDPNNSHSVPQYNGRESRDPSLQHHSRENLVNKDMQKHLLIDNSARQQKISDPNKLIGKHDPNRVTNYQKRPGEIVNSDKKLVLQQNISDKNNYLLNKLNNTTSQKLKSPFSNTDLQKSVPFNNNPATQQQNYQKYDVNSSNLNKNGNNVEKQWLEATQQQEEPVSTPPTPVINKRQPSLFSPEKTTPPKKQQPTTQAPIEKKVEVPQSISPLMISPEPRRHRNSSSSQSEPELRPVVKKLDQISGFENIIRDSKMGIKLPHKVPDIIQPICDRKPPQNNETNNPIWKDLKPPEIITPIVNGIETDPTLISNLLKENPAPATHLPVIESKKIEETAVSVPQPIVNDNNHHHKSEKKKKKDKHKHKDKDKSKEEKKKHKHKDKDREKHKKVEPSQEEVTPLKITIPKEKIQPANPTNPPIQTSGLKVKISKDRLQQEPEKPPSLKIKISKDAIQYNSVNDNSNSKKRDRDRANNQSPNVIGPPTKMFKHDSQQNGRNSYSKVSHYNNNNSRGRYMNNNNNMPQRMNNPPSLFQQNHHQPPIFVPNYPPPAYMYHQPVPPDMYQFYSYPMYPPQEMYCHQNAPPPQNSNAPPPLPDGPPPNIPPPPPPE